MARAVPNLSNLSELKNRFFFTLIMLAVYRLGVYVPVAGFDKAALERLVNQGAFSMMNVFSGGAIEGASLFALGIMPYITASIIFQVLSVAIPTLKALQDEGQSGRDKINQWTRYATVVIAFFQAFLICSQLVGSEYVLPSATGMKFVLTATVTVAAGSIFMMWLGEQITERGIGNGISLLIFAGIVSRVPMGIGEAWINRDDFLGFPGFILLLVFLFLLVSVIIYFERCHRKVPIHYAKRMMGRKMYAGQTSHLPLKINMAGVIPAIFASALLMFPQTLNGLVTEPGLLKEVVTFLSQPWFQTTIYVSAIVFFTYFYTAIVFNPVEVAENLQKNGGFIPGIRPGKPTSEYLDRILSRVTLGGALYLVAVCVLPQFLIAQFNIPPNLAYTFGGTSVLIMVGVAMDTMSQVESHLMARNYEGLMGSKGGRFKGRKA